MKNLFIIFGLILFASCYFLLMFLGWDFKQSLTAATALLSAFWWSTEAIPIPITSLIPLALLPLSGIINKTHVSESYGSPLILLLLGGFILSKSLEKSGVHRRIALGLVNILGGENPKRLVLGFMIASGVLSMWISNTATVLMLFPVALAVIEKTPSNTLTVPLLLSIAYGASIGGIGTPVGTPPNLIFMEIYKQTTGSEIGFIQWMSFAIPVVIVMIPVSSWWLTRGLQAAPVSLPQMGGWSKAEKRVFTVFSLTAILWMTRTPENWGWMYLLELPWANDAYIALLAAVSLFIIPNGETKENGEKDRLLDWNFAKEIPWDILLLFAGGIALAKAFTVSGLSLRISEQLVALSSLPTFLMIAGIALIVTFLTEVTSNTATTTLLMPILAAAAIAAKIDPAILMVPAALSASCAFMLPVATAPNAIIFGTGKVPIKSMIHFGLVLNLVGAIVISFFVYFLV